ncbi:hypothetical protein HN51_011859, partial [Arachis hypogaea]
ERRVNPSRPVALLRHCGLRSSVPPRRLQAVALSLSSSSRGPQQSTPVALRRPQ